MILSLPCCTMQISREKFFHIGSLTLLTLPAKIKKNCGKIKLAIEISHFKSSSWAHCLFSYTESLHSHGLLLTKEYIKTHSRLKLCEEECRREFENDYYRMKRLTQNF